MHDHDLPRMPQAKGRDIHRAFESNNACQLFARGRLARSTLSIARGHKQIWSRGRASRASIGVCVSERRCRRMKQRPVRNSLHSCIPETRRLHCRQQAGQHGRRGAASCAPPVTRYGATPSS
eukprot:scaffold166696_cov31-Tisochrysis_lutea.AAC.3